MGTTFTVGFGPSRSKRFGKAVAWAKKVDQGCAEDGAGHYRASFDLGEDPAAYAALASLLERVRHWRSTEVHDEDGQVPAFHAKEMAWCASSQLRFYGTCRFRYIYGVMPRCAYCPLFDAERALNDLVGENPPPTAVFEIELGPNLRALLRGEVPPDLDEVPEAELEVPNFVPEDWGGQPGEDPLS